MTKLIRWTTLAQWEAHEISRIAVQYVRYGSASVQEHAPEGYIRRVLHVSKISCFKRKFLSTPVYCTDGRTVGTHYPGTCPFKVEPYDTVKDEYGE